MLLWTIQSPAAVAALERKGVLVADHGAPEPSFRPAFDWMARRMSQRLGPPPPNGRPLWAWQVWSAATARPDLRSSGHLPRGQRGARIGFVADPARVVLSDFEGWHYVLNHWYLPASSRDERLFAAQVRAAGLDHHTHRLIPDRRLQSHIEASWDRIFRIGPSGGRPSRHLAVASTQATFWSLPRASVRSIQWFTAR